MRMIPRRNGRRRPAQSWSLYGWGWKTATRSPERCRGSSQPYSVAHGGGALGSRRPPSRALARVARPQRCRGAPPAPDCSPLGDRCTLDTARHIEDSSTWSQSLRGRGTSRNSTGGSRTAEARRPAAWRRGARSRTRTSPACRRGSWLGVASRAHFGILALLSHFPRFKPLCIRPSSSFLHTTRPLRLCKGY